MLIRRRHSFYLFKKNVPTKMSRTEKNTLNSAKALENLDFKITQGGTGSSQSLQSVGIFGNYNDDRSSVKVSADGKLEVLADLDISSQGLATSALQTTGNTALSSINTKISKGIGATLANAQQVLNYGLNTNSNNCKALEIDNAGNLRTTLQSVSGTVVMKTNDNTLNTKISKGEDATIVSGSGGLQQVLMYGMDNQGDLEPLNIDNSGHLKMTINDVDETNTGLKIAGETAGGSQVNLRTETNGSLNVALTSGQITGFSTSALQTDGNTLLTSMDSTLTDGIQIKGKIGGSTVDLEANANGHLYVKVAGSSGNGGNDLYTNATLTANTASGNITILTDRVISIMGSTTTANAKIGLAFVDQNSAYWPSPEYADLYYDGTKYTFCMTVSNVLTDNVKVYFQTAANNVNVNYFTY